jgi:S-adenosylmethionine:tRNA ribosyltransferase-isomerase
VNLSSFDFPLPEHLIAQHPLPERDQSRLMVIRRQSRTVEHRIFRELPDILQPDHFLVINTTRVIPARLWARRPGKRERIEVLMTREEAPGSWLVLVRPAHKALPGQPLEIGDACAYIREVREGGARLIEFASGVNPWKSMETLGEPPLPPYIRRHPGQDLTQDAQRYQTVYARQSGSIAAPTAGLHFTPEVMHRLAKKNIPVCEILLHVGYGTFQPVRSEEIEQHRMEPEYYEVSDDAAAAIRANLNEDRRLIAVGTTTTRVLEHLARQVDFLGSGSAGLCDLFIRPGFEFHALSGLLSNFHLPKSTLLMLVCAFAGREWLLDCYRQAVQEGYRFYSYGDCMLIL